MLVMIMCMSVFTGCALWTRDDAKYYNTTVATINYVDGDRDLISRQELLTAFDSYGYNYVQNEDYTTAIETTLETIINKRVTIKAVENYYAELGEEVLNENETTYLWDETLKALYSNLESYFFEVIDYTKPEEAEEQTANKSVYVAYESEVEIVEKDGKLVIEKKNPATTIRATYEAKKMGDYYYDYEFEVDGERIFRDKMYEDLKNLASDSTDKETDQQWKTALNNYKKDIEKKYSYKNFADEKACFEFELDRVYNIIKDDYMVEKYEVIYNTRMHQDANRSSVRVQDILMLYNYKVKTDFASYTAVGGKEAFESAILSDTANVDYILETKDLTDGVASNYFSVGYIKLNLDSNLQAQLKELESRKDEFTYESEYNNAVDNIYKQVYTYVRNANTGEQTDEKAYAYDTEKGDGLLTKIAQDIKNAGDDDIDKANEFRKYLYLYNDDDALKGAQYNTVFGINSDGEVLANDTFSSNEEVKEAIKNLYNNGNAKVGDLSDIVRSTDGVYIFFYAGEVKNLFSPINSSINLASNEQNILVLKTARLNIFDTKTVFDSLYETLNQDNFTIYQNMDINNLRNELTKGDIIINENAIKNL